MRIWVSGAGGMMGSHLLEKLSSEGHQVLGTYFKPTIDLTELSHSLPIEEVDLTDWSALTRSLGSFQPEMIFHLGAQSLPTQSWISPLQTLEVNVLGTANLFECLRFLKISPRVVVACSSAEYGELRADQIPTKEETQLLPLHPYGVSKVAQDLLAFQYFKNFGIPTYRARIFNCTGPRKVNDMLSDFVRRVVFLERQTELKVLHVGNLETSRALVDVRDLNRGLIAIALKGKPGEAYNLSGNQAYKIKDVCALILRLSRRSDLDLRIRDDLLRPSDEICIWGDTTKVQIETGWSPQIALEQTISDVFAYWRSKPDSALLSQ